MAWKGPFQPKPFYDDSAIPVQTSTQVRGCSPGRSGRSVQPNGSLSPENLPRQRPCSLSGQRHQPSSSSGEGLPDLLLPCATFPTGTARTIASSSFPRVRRHRCVLREGRARMPEEHGAAKALQVSLARALCLGRGNCPPQPWGQTLLVPGLTSPVES